MFSLITVLLNTWCIYLMHLLCNKKIRRQALQCTIIIFSCWISHWGISPHNNYIQVQYWLEMRRFPEVLVKKNSNSLQGNWLSNVNKYRDINCWELINCFVLEIGLVSVNKWLISTIVRLESYHCRTPATAFIR